MKKKRDLERLWLLNKPMTCLTVKFSRAGLIYHMDKINVAFTCLKLDYVGWSFYNKDELSLIHN